MISFNEINNNINGVQSIINSLNNIPSQSLNLLKKHNLLKQLAKAELTETLLKEVNVNEEKETELLEDFRNQNNFQDENEFSKFLSNKGLEKETFNQALVNQYKFKKYLEKFSHQVKPRFLQRKNDLDIVTYSLIRVKESHLAWELYLRISENESSFSDIAYKYSEGPERQTRGIIGPIPLLKAHPEVISFLSSNEDGSLSQPLRVGEWFLILRLESLDKATLDESMELKMCQEIFEEKLDQDTDFILESLEGLTQEPQKT